MIINAKINEEEKLTVEFCEADPHVQPSNKFVQIANAKKNSRGNAPGNIIITVLLSFSMESKQFPQNEAPLLVFTFRLLRRLFDSVFPS